MEANLINIDSVGENMQCLCSNPVEDSYERHSDFDHDGRDIILCKMCGTERREIDFRFGEDYEENPTNHEQGCDDVITSSAEVRKKIRVGDHVGWKRQIFKSTLKYNHHGIVTYIDDQIMKVTHYTRPPNRYKWKCTVEETTFRLDDSKEMGYGNLFCINYPSKLTQLNPPSTVINRAMSKLHKGGYSLIFNNCESFARYCKSGIERSFQVSNRVCKFLRGVMGVLKATCTSPRMVTYTCAAIGGEGLEAAQSMLTGVTANVIGGTMFVLAEGVLCLVDLYKLYDARIDESLTKEEFKALTCKRLKLFIGKALAGFTGSVIGSLVFAISYGGIGAAVGYVVGNVPGAVVGMKIGEVIGGFLGGVCGGIGAVEIYRDERMHSWSLRNRRGVESMLALQLGDHVILPEGRGDAIISGLKHDENKIRVIRNDHRRGVVEEWIAYIELHKMMYGLGECYPVPQVLKNARSHLGKRYHLAPFHSLKFVVEQKMKKEANF